jgi:hypothetical protein
MERRKLPCVGNLVSLILRSKRFGKNRTKIISAFEQNGSRIKQLRKPERSDVVEARLKWFKHQRSDIDRDDDVKTEAQTDEDIVREVRHKNGKLDSEEEEEKAEVPAPSVSEALEAMRVVKCLYEARAGHSKIALQIMGIGGQLEN